MRDQASELRSLVLRAGRHRAAMQGPAPHVIAITSGKGGVGVTTLAVRLAIALADQAARVVLIDADPQRADIANICRLKEGGNINELMSGRRDIHEVLARGPAGVLVLPGLWAQRGVAPWSESSQHRLLRQIRGLGPHADVVVMDIGNGISDLARRFWLAVDEVVLVTRDDAISIMDTYAATKALADQESPPRLGLIVNCVADSEISGGVHQRLSNSCQRFLNLPLTLLGHVPWQRSPASLDERPAEAAAEVPNHETEISCIGAKLLSHAAKPLASWQEPA